MRVLIIGAGAVGLVYARHLADGGADVALYVRPSRREEALTGYDLTRVHTLSRRSTVRFQPKHVVTSAAEVEALDFDQAWVATSTNALAEPWLVEILAAVPRAIVVFLQPGTDVPADMARLVADPARRVRGAITMASWSSPLESSLEARERATPKGIAYLLPPLAANGFEGARAAEVVQALKRGGCPAVRTDVTRSLAESSSILLPLIGVLELAGWSLSTLASSRSDLAVSSGREALTIACATIGARPPLLARALFRVPLVRIAARLAPRLVPFDLEVYLRVHFLKVREQTLLLLDEYLREGRARALQTEALASLRRQLG